MNIDQELLTELLERLCDRSIEPNDLDIPVSGYVCKDCGEECGVVIVDDSFDYPTGYGSGYSTEIDVYTGSDCCEAEYVDLDTLLSAAGEEL